MTGEKLLESLDRHFLAGCPSLSTTQLDQHKTAGVCPECQLRAENAGFLSLRKYQQATS